MKGKLILCRIKRGNVSKLTWLNESLAKMGTRIKIRKENGFIDRGWSVIRVRSHMVRDDKEGERLFLAI